MPTPQTTPRVYVCDTSGTGSCTDYGPGLDLVDDEHRCALDTPHDGLPHECLCGTTWPSC